MDYFLNDFSRSAHFALTKSQIILSEKLKCFFEDECGNTTVEFVLWVPVFMLILILTADVSLSLYRYSNIYYVARNTARQVAIHRWSLSEAVAKATEKTTFSSNQPIVSINPSDDFSRVNVVIEVPINTVGVFGTLSLDKDIKLVATSSANFEVR